MSSTDAGEKAVVRGQEGGSPGPVRRAPTSLSGLQRRVCRSRPVPRPGHGRQSRRLCPGALYAGGAATPALRVSAFLSPEERGPRHTVGALSSRRGGSDLPCWVNNRVARLFGIKSLADAFHLSNPEGSFASEK